MEGERQTAPEETSGEEVEVHPPTPRVDAFSLPDDSINKAIISFRTATGYANPEALELGREKGW